MSDKYRETILVVDDLPENIRNMAAVLQPDYRVTFATSGLRALQIAREHPQPSLILLDLVMPDIDGYETCRKLKSDLRTADIPVIFVTAQDDVRHEEIGLSIGAVDYLHKPCHPSIVLQRVRIHLELRNQNLALEARVRERTRALDETRVEIIRRLARAGEYRDNETGMHVIRMSKYCQRLALAAGISESQAELMLLASPMHDIGKIGIPDAILLKPGKFTDEERKVMQQHAVIGAEIIGDHPSDLLRLARQIALTHHERWDGTGYPNAIANEAIPIEGRIAAICDVFDALVSTRPYKAAWRVDDALEFIASQSEKSFDPELVRLFLEISSDILEIGKTYQDKTP